MTELIIVTIYRFLCPTCKDTHSVVPAFFRPKHTVANEVQEAVVARLDSGEAMRSAGEEICTGVTIDKKTVRRWKTFWETLVTDQENVFVQQALLVIPALVLPVGLAKKAVAGSPFRWLRYIRRQVSQTTGRVDSVGLFTTLFRLHSSMALAVVP